MLLSFLDLSALNTLFASRFTPNRKGCTFADYRMGRGGRGSLAVTAEGVPSLALNGLNTPTSVGLILLMQD